MLLHQVTAASQMVQNVDRITATVEHGNRRGHDNSAAAQPRETQAIVAQDDIAQAGSAASWSRMRFGDVAVHKIPPESSRQPFFPPGTTQVLHARRARSVNGLQNSKPSCAPNTRGSRAEANDHRPATVKAAAGPLSSRRLRP